LRQIDQPPADHAVHCRNRATLDDADDGLALDVVELGRLARRLAVQEAVRAALVEVQYPVPDDLKPDAADFRCLGARRIVIDRRQRKKPTGLRAVFRLFCQAPQLWRIKITAQRYRSRHDEPPWFAMLNQTRGLWGIAQESPLQGPSITDLAAP
jgi:hypothetical protein